MMYFGYGYGLPKAVKTLLIANVVVFLVTTLMMTRVAYFYFGLIPALVVQRFYIWQIVTHMFLHGSFGHIFFNMFALWMFGAELEYNWGTRDFIKYYFACGIGGGLFVIITAYMGLGSLTIPTVGASGAIFGLLVAFGMMWPDRMIFIFGILPIKALHFVIIFAAINIFYGFSGTGGNVAYFAHIGGGLTGFIYLKFGWRIAAYAEHFGKKIKRRRFTVIPGGRNDSNVDNSRHEDNRGNHPDYSEEVDRILDKIARQGMDSLTDHERKILDRASNRR